MCVLRSCHLVIFVLQETTSSSLDTSAKPDTGKETVGKKSIPKDPFLEKDALNKFVIDVERFQKVVEWLSKQTLNGPTALEQKWKELMDTQDRESRKLSISVARCCALKNRMQDIMPCESFEFLAFKSLQSELWLVLHFVVCR